MITSRFVDFNHSGVSDMMNHWVMVTFTYSSGIEVFKTHLRKKNKKATRKNVFVVCQVMCDRNPINVVTLKGAG